MKPTAYYAHAMSLYHTPQEERDIHMLERLGFAVINPATCTSKDMEFYLSLVTTCNALAFRALPDGRITSGVFKEIRVAEMSAMDVFELPANMFGRAMTEDETRGYLREVGQR